MTLAPVAHVDAGDVTTAAPTSGTSVTIDRPANTAAGDLLICVVFHHLSGGTLTRPGGWESCGPSGNSVGTFESFSRAVSAVGNEPANYTWTNTGSDRACAVMFRVTGHNPTVPIDAFGTVSTVGTTTVTAPGITTVQDQTLLVAAWESSKGAGTPSVITPPDPMMAVGSATSAPSSSSTLQVAVTTRGDAGAVSSKTATISPTASSATAFMFAIAPASSTTPTTTLPEVRLEVAFTDGASTGTMLTLDDPARGKLDTGTLGGGLTSSPVWTDISTGGLLRSCTVERGSRRVDAPIVTYEAGTLTAVLDNVDRRFDPTWLDGPYTAESSELDGTSTTLNSNGDVETGTTTGWGSGSGGTVTADTAHAHGGTYAIKFVPTGSASNPFVDTAWQALTAGQTYRATAWVWCTADTTVAASIHWYTSTPTFISQSSASTYVTAGTWTQVSVTGVAPAGCTQGPMLITMVGTPAASNVMWVDDADFAHLPYLRATQVTAMRAVRLSATWDGTTYELWRGFADQWEVTWTAGSDYSECTLTATDASKVLSGVDRTAVDPAVGGGEDSGARVTRILDSAGWPAGDRIVAAGDSTLQETTLEGDAWAELQTVAASELGELFVDGGGRIVFRNRRSFLTRAASLTSQGTFGDTSAELPAEDVAVAGDDATFFNDVRVTVAGGTEQVAEDADSQALYYRKTYRPPVEPLLETDADALAYAQWLLHIAAAPELRFTDLQVLAAAGPSDLWPQALGREVGDRITVIRRPPVGDPIQREVFVRGIRHEFTDGTWTTTWALQDASRYGSFFVLDHAELGVLDSNALAY